MYPSSVATRRVKPLPKRRRTDSISTSVPSNVNLNHYYHSSASPHFNSNVHTYNSLPFPLPQNLPDPHSLPPLPPNLPSTPPVPSLLPISDELLTQWRDYCLPLLGSAADALLSAGGLGGQVYSGGRSGNPNSTRGSERDQTAGGGAGGGEPNPPNPLFPFSQLTPQVASQLTAQLESFVSLASAAVSAASGGTGGGSQPESSANFANTAASLGGPPSLSSPNQGPGPTPPQLDPVTAATYFTHHLNASLRAAGLSGAFPPTAPQPTVSTTDSLYSNRPKVMGGDKGHTPNGISTQPLPSHHDRVLEADEVGGGVSDRDYREDELDDRDDRDDDRANGRNNTKKRKVPGLFSRSGVMNGDGTERVVNGYGVNGLPLDIRAGEGEGVVDTEGNRIREIEYTGELGRGNRGMMGHESRRPRARPTMSRVTMAGIQHKTRKRQLASVLLRGVNENVPHNNASTVPITSGVQNEGAKVKPHTGATTASVSTELALDQMLSDLTGLGLYSYPSLGLPPRNGTAASLTEKPKVKVRLSKRKGVRNARKVSHGGGKEGKSSGKVNKENDLPPPPASITGKKKKGRGSGARAEPSGDTDEAKDGGSEERGILVPKCNFTFTYRSASELHIPSSAKFFLLVVHNKMRYSLSLFLPTAVHLMDSF
ncbi:hypothetical protein E1B28_007214 [Marasmius oreades]|uniref:Uncharacterized protein n=1 Tax=Marasmius oreades TaxID=181124 RepID=A0A9P7UVM8_9AGAR|nr:uncharacterized protein E1B28_007214 [Marasmius oreades]KAG7093544.1 hypothetical protein E1B28_007214 [Marasmius oreades]